MGNDIRIESRPCALCDGTGKVYGDECPRCEGAGTTGRLMGVLPYDPFDLDFLVVDELAKECEAAGSQTASAKAHGFSPSFVNDVLQYRRRPTDRLALALGYRRVVTWQKIEQER